MFDGLAAPASRFDGAFYIYLLARGGVIQFHNLGVNRGPPPIWHNQAVEAQHHSRPTLDSAGHIDLRDMPIDSRVPVFTIVHDRCAEGIADLRVGTGQSVVEANA